MRIVSPDIHFSFTYDISGKSGDNKKLSVL